MQNITLIGIDLGKHSFHIHCQDKSGKALLRKKFTRTKLMQFLATCPPSVVVIIRPKLACSRCDVIV
ncbi:TPA: IS110 family transposase, partial [Shigella flexneri]|nr:hypothetical protein [Shigella flexneri]EFF9347143.1 hypothetical protein [Escherichia coli]EAA1750069.1 hypothetical protein [Shigella flexneri]EFG3276551.1 hypothetical protein [Escherichia coli]EFP8484096.1 IS110 family transposase [Shigella flexneri]